MERSARAGRRVHNGSESAMTNPVIHFEIGGRDLGRMVSFYRDLFGWQPLPAGPEYSLIPAQFAMIGDPDGNLIGLLRQEKG
jgi:hypothetical protein